MAEKSLLADRTILNVAGDFEELHTYFRIMREMLSDQLCNYAADDVQSRGQALDCIHNLVNMIPEKLTYMKSLNAELVFLNQAHDSSAVAA